MNQERQMVKYDELFPKSHKERLRIINNISAENIAQLVKTHAKRWLAVNRSRLNDEQISLAEEMIQSITHKWYIRDQNSEEIPPEAESLIKKIETVFSREDLLQFATLRADYIPAGENGND